MKNVLLVFEHSIEFDFIRVMLNALGLNPMSLHKNPEVRKRLKDKAPDLVLTTVLASSDEIIAELVQRRQTLGTPRFIWVGSTKNYKALTKNQLELVDGILPTPIQPEKLIEVISEHLSLSREEMMQKYQKIQGRRDDQNDVVYVKDTERSRGYDDFLKKVENKDRVLNLKEMQKLESPAVDENTTDLLEKKKGFLKALFKK